MPHNSSQAIADEDGEAEQRFAREKLELVDHAAHLNQERERLAQEKAVGAMTHGFVVMAKVALIEDAPQHHGGVPMMTRVVKRHNLGGAPQIVDGQSGKHLPQTLDT